MKDYDIYRIWGITWASMRSWLTYHYGLLRGKKIIDENKKNSLLIDKFYQSILMDHLWYKYPKSIFFVVHENVFYDQIKLLLDNFDFPIIAKKVDEDRWIWVFLLKNEKEVTDFIYKNNKNSIIFQEYIENDWDYRILIVWDEVIWTFKRQNKDSFLNNVSKWGETFLEELPSEINKIAIDITKGLWHQISWVDIFYQDGGYNIIEVNELPQYDGFEKITWVSYSEKVLEYFKKIN